MNAFDNYNVSSEKRPKCFYVISPIKLKRCWRNLVYHFLNKFAAKGCKRFPPHLNNVSALPCETQNAHCARATYHCYQKKLLQNSSHCNCGLQIWIQLITACGKYCKRRCTKHSSLICSLARVEQSSARCHFCQLIPVFQKTTENFSF